jgi:hypothetical protein
MDCAQCAQCVFSLFLGLVGGSIGSILRPKSMKLEGLGGGVLELFLGGRGCKLEVRSMCFRCKMS